MKEECKGALPLPLDTHPLSGRYSFHIPKHACRAAFESWQIRMESIESGDWTSHHAGVCA